MWGSLEGWDLLLRDVLVFSLAQKNKFFLSLLYFSFLPLSTTAMLRFQICRSNGFVKETKS